MTTFRKLLSLIIFCSSAWITQPVSAQSTGAINLVVGQSRLIDFAQPITRAAVANPQIADISVISAKQLLVLGKALGSTNLLLWEKSGVINNKEIEVSMDTTRILAKLRQVMPAETDIAVMPVSDSIVLSGKISSAIKSHTAEQVVQAMLQNHALSTGTEPSTGEGAQKITSKGRVINLLQVQEVQQVMLEVIVAEVSKNALHKLGAQFLSTNTDGNWSMGITSKLLGSSASVLSLLKKATSTTYSADIDAEDKQGLIKILAQPNLVALSGQEASFLAGGKIFIPVARSDQTTGASSITLEEKDYGVGIKFLPTVLEGGLIHLQVSPEVSELSQTGSPFATLNGQTAVLPSFTTRRAQTSVQLQDGQSFAIAGLMKNNVQQAITKVPGIGELPILGALFGSSEFQSNQTELLFVITPHLVQPTNKKPTLPTDAFTPPNPFELHFLGKMEGGQNAKPGNSSPATQGEKP